MTPLFRSYSPRSLPLDYDSLASDIGCQPIDGNVVYGFEGMVNLCVAEHTSDASSIFSKSDAVSYFPGPNESPDLPPFPALWAAWFSDTQVRAGRFSSITPPANDTGSDSHLFPDIVGANSLSGSFNRDGFMAIAIYIGEETIALRQFTNEEGDYVETVWGGAYPLLWFIGNALNSDDPSEMEIVALYLRPERPREIFGRFERDSYGVEKIICPDLPVSLSKLLHANVDNQNRLVIYALDKDGRDVTIYSDKYPIKVGDDEILAVSWFSGLHYEAAIEVDADTDKNTLGLSWHTGYMLTSAISGGTISSAGHKVPLGLEWLEGSHS